MTKLNKAQISKLNLIAHDEFTRAQAMLQGINMVLGTDYKWLNKRVVFMLDGKIHDAYTWAEE